MLSYSAWEFLAAILDHTERAWRSIDAKPYAILALRRRLYGR